MGEIVLLEYDNTTGVGIITFNRPEKLNALSREMIAAATELLSDVEIDPKYRALVIAGAGRAFCAGQDTRDLAAGANRSSIDAVPGAAAPLPRALSRFPKPVVAAIQGVAIGAGFDVALACDMRIAETTARMGDWHVNRGYVPSASLYYFPRLVGMGKAAEMLMLGQLVDGSEAAGLGLVNRAVDEGTARAEALSLASELAKGPPVTLQYIKKLLRQSDTENLESLMAAVADARVVGQATGEPKEGTSAFAEKREPNWRR